MMEDVSSFEILWLWNQRLGAVKQKDIVKSLAMAYV